MVDVTMGEDATVKEDDVQNNGDGNSDEEMNSDSEEEEIEDMTPEEFEAIDSQLDALNNALDDIEQKNDNIHAQLLQLLEENKEIRRQMQEANQSDAKKEESPK